MTVAPLPDDVCARLPEGLDPSVRAALLVDHHTPGMHEYGVFQLAGLSSWASTKGHSHVLGHA